MLPKGYRDNRKHDAKTLRTRYTIDQDRQMDDQTHTATAPRSSLSPELPPAHTLEAAHTRHTVRWNSTPPDIRMCRCALRAH